MISSPALALTARVPEDFSTIQAAVDHLEQSYEVDTVVVQAGHYPERVYIREAIRLLGLPAPGSAEPMPRIDGLLVQPPSSGDVIAIVGIHVTGPARTAGSNGPDQVSYESCRFDAGMEGGNWYPDIAVISMRRCTLFGTVSLKAVETVIDSCTVHGPIVLLAVGAAVVTDNMFEDVPGFAADIICEQQVNVARNVVRRGGGGFSIRYTDQDFVHVEDNIIEGCAGIGIYIDTPDFYSVYMERNQVTRCGGTGIHASGLINVRENLVLDCGGHGLDLVQQDGTGLVEANVVGRCKGDGIRLQRYEWAQSPTGFQSRSNTVYDCDGVGIFAYALTSGSISKNIVYRNHGYGLRAEGNESVLISCNDLNGNVAGATFGAPPSTNDLDLDPLFCDVENDDVGLRSDSPLLDAPGCGLIGALGQGCEAPVVAMRLAIWPRVLQPASRARWVTAFLEPPSEFPLAEIDIASARLNDVPVAQGTDAVPGDQDRDGIPDLQLQFDREAFERTLTSGEQVTVTITGRIGRRSFTGTDQIRVLRYPGGPHSEGPRNAARERVLSIHMPHSLPGLRIEFTLAEETPARLDVLDVAGRVVSGRDLGSRPPGEYTLDLTGEGLAQGIYFLRLRQGASEARTRMLVVR